MSFAIVADSTCDLNPDEYTKYNVTMIPLRIEIDGETFEDQVQLTCDEFFDRMEASDNLPKSSQPTPYDFQKLYESLFEQGYEGIISFHIADVLSGTYTSACTAAELVEGDVRVINSCTAAAPLGQLVRNAAIMRDAGATLDEVEAYITQAIAESGFFIACESLENLLKGGRLAPEEVQAAGALNIKPVFTFDERGVLKAHAKVRGMNGVVKQYVEEIAKYKQQYGSCEVRFFHARNESTVEKIKAALQDAEIDYIDGGTCKCGATIAAHVGTGAVGIGLLPCMKA